MFLAAAADRRRSPRHITDILDNMTELYTAAGGIFLGAEYANRDGLNERRDINPALPVRLRHHDAAALLERAAGRQRRRWLARPLHHSAAPRTTIPRRITGAGIRVSPPELLDSLRLIAAGGGAAACGQSDRHDGRAETALDPIDRADARRARRRHSGTLGAEITTELPRGARNGA